MKIFGRDFPWAATLCTIAAVHLLSGLRGVDGHGFLTAPKVEFLDRVQDITEYSATIESATALPVPPGMHYDWGPGPAVEAFEAAFEKSPYKTLREFVMKHQQPNKHDTISPECGHTKGANASGPQPLPVKYVVWQHGNNEGFTASHEGPCEVWCDDERVFVEKNCAKKYPQIPAKLPYERAKCVGKKRLQFVWLALHEAIWQVYINCAPLANAEGATPTGDGQAAVNSSSTAGPGTVQPFSPTPTAAVRTKTPFATVSPYPQVETLPPAVVAASTATLMASSPAPVTKRPPTTTDDEYSNTAIDRLLATRPPTSASTNVRTSTSTAYEDASPNAPASNDGHDEYTELSSATQSPHPRPCETTTRPRPRPYQQVSWPRRAAEGDEDGDEDDGSGILASTGTGGLDPYAKLATGPIPDKIFQQARRDFEAEEKMKAERRFALKKEFGYA